MSHYFTLSANQGGPGCVEVRSDDYAEARRLMIGTYGMEWAFQYESLEKVHPADREILDVIEVLA